MGLKALNKMHENIAANRMMESQFIPCEAGFRQLHSSKHLGCCCMVSPLAFKQDVRHGVLHFSIKFAALEITDLKCSRKASEEGSCMS